IPFDRATGIGSTFDCADHSKSVCFFDSATISSPLIVLFSVSVAIYVLARLKPRAPSAARLKPSRSSALQHRIALGFEFVSRLPVGKCAGLRDAVADSEQYSEIFVQARQI